MSDFSRPVAADKLEFLCVKIEGIKGPILTSTVSEENDKMWSIYGSEFLESEKFVIHSLERS